MARPDLSWVAVAGGTFCAVAGGELWCGGSSPLIDTAGSGTVAWRRIGTRTDWRTIEFGSGRACGLRADGDLVCWGSAAGGTIESPRNMGRRGTWTAVSVYRDIACGISSGSIYCWGEAEGTLIQLREQRDPVWVAGSDYVDVVVTRLNACALSLGGELGCWGDHATTLSGAPYTRPVAVGETTGWAALSRDTPGCAIRDDGGLFCWDEFGTIPGQTSPGTLERVGEDFEAIAITDVPDRMACAYRAGELICAGQDRKNQLARGVPAFATTATPADSVVWTSLAASLTTGCGLDEAGRARCWGRPHGSTPVDVAPGESGFDDFTMRFPWVLLASRGGSLFRIEGGVATQVAGVDEVTDLHSACVIAGGALRCERSNVFGGGGHWTDFPVVAEGEDWTAVAGGAVHICGLRGPGELWCGGQGAHGVLGDGDPTPRLVPPQRVGTENTWTAVATNTYGTCAVRSGELHCTGRIHDRAMARSTLARFGAASDWESIEGYRAWMCGIRSDGVYCFGENPLNGWYSPGRLIAETRFASGGGWSDLAVGDTFACAMRAGQRHCWGLDHEGELGTGRSLASEIWAATASPVRP